MSSIWKVGIAVGALFLSLLIAFLIWYHVWVSFIDNYELGFTYNRFSGKIEVLNHTGWVVRNPWEYGVHKIDLRPYQLSISANSRVLNAKLVRFNPAGLATFIEWHGRDAGDSVSELKEILKCYAFDRADGKDCPFLTVLQELAPGQGITKPQTDEKN
ncbi:MAG: hypothetical protein HZA36_03605 [Parcubacteria group bacterium]|nr:hypothetical protein [Parcubacteria group bacterium]